MKPIRVGIIGMEVDRSWSAIGHLPAIRSIPGYEVVAVATTRRESAEAAAARYGIPRAYTGHGDLVADPDIDLVVVTVKVPAHKELVTAAIHSGKNVFCEWPLGNGLAEAEAMAEHARKAGIIARVCLQARYAPGVAYVRDLVAAGFVGDVLSSTLVGSGMSWSGPVNQRDAYGADRNNGATMLSVVVGHALEAVCGALGELSDISSTLAARPNTTTIIETGQVIPVTADNQVAFSGRFDNGAIFSAHYRGGMRPGTGFLWEIYGSAGTLRISAMGGQAQMLELAIEGANGTQSALVPMEIPKSYYTANTPLRHVANLAELYIRLEKDLREGSQLTPTFEDGVARHRLLAEIETAARRGR
jgi:predicted dehydrogenase